jgi:hypothetical protein
MNKHLRLRNIHAFVTILGDFIAEGADRNSQNIGGVGAVAKAMVEGIQNHLAFDISDGASNQIFNSTFIFRCG